MVRKTRGLRVCDEDNGAQTDQAILRAIAGSRLERLSSLRSDTGLLLASGDGTERPSDMNESGHHTCSGRASGAGAEVSR